MRRFIREFHFSIAASHEDLWGTNLIAHFEQPAYEMYIFGVIGTFCMITDPTNKLYHTFVGLISKFPTPFTSFAFQR